MSSAFSVASPTSASTTNANNASARATMRPSNQVKTNNTNDGNRKQSPSDTASRRAPTQKAWTGASNPLTQRSSSTTHANGIAAPAKSSPKMGGQKEAGVSDKQAHDRTIFIFGAFIGLNMIISTKGDTFEGLMAGSTVASGTTRITLKMAKRVQQADIGHTNGTTSREAALVGTSPEHVLTIDVRDITDWQVPDFSMPEPAKMANGSATKFQTDSDISGNQLRAERTLQPWVPDGPENAGLSLEAGASGDWDQFATNRQLFGTQSTYDENFYTTTLDRSSESYKMREAKATRLAREIEGSQSGNAHSREERGHVAQNDDGDEEAKYSGVKRDDLAFSQLTSGGANKYTPPARRAPTAMPTVVGAPHDPAIISAQLSRPASKPSQSGQTQKENISDAQAKEQVASVAVEPETQPIDAADIEDNDKVTALPTTQKAVSPTGHTEGVEKQVLQQFRQFADSEKQKLVEKKRAQATQDRAAKLNDLLRFSRTFKLKSAIPSDLVGILAKDPNKQEAIIEKAKREHEESTSASASPAAAPAAEAETRPTELPQMAAIPDRQTFNRARGIFPQTSGRPDRTNPAQGPFPPRAPGGPQRPGQQERKPVQIRDLPPPIPILNGRIPPTGPMADQLSLASPQRSQLQTPTSAISPSRFNLNVKAMEFRPNANAASFDPSASSNAPSSPSSIQRTASVSRAPSPSTFFGSRKPKPASERLSLSSNFNPLKKLKAEVEARKNEKTSKGEEGPGSVKDYSPNGGIPNAYQASPRWTVRVDNDKKSYLEAFERPLHAASPAQSRSGSAHQIPYHSQLPHLQHGPANIPQLSTPQHMQHGNTQNFAHQYEDGQPRLHMPMAGQAFASPNMQHRQPSAYASPMAGPAQLAYGQPQYFGGGGQMPMRQYPGTPGMMHPQGGMAAPMMIQQHSNGPYMSTPQQHNQQMQMYSPNPPYVYPQPNGYGGSPSRAPIMIHQGSQQGHHGQPMVYTMSQGGPGGYNQGGQMGTMRGYGNQQYGSPQHGYPLQQQRTMSSGYGQIPQKVMPSHLQSQGPPPNAPNQPAAFGQMELGQENGK